MKSKFNNLYNQIPYQAQDPIFEGDKNTCKHQIQENQEVSPFPAGEYKNARQNHKQTGNTYSEKDLQNKRLRKVSKDAKIRSRYNQVPHPTQDTNGH